MILVVNAFTSVSYVTYVTAKFPLVALVHMTSVDRLIIFTEWLLKKGTTMACSLVETVPAIVCLFNLQYYNLKKPKQLKNITSPYLIF